MKKIDKYIITKFLGTFVYAIGIIILIAVVFDISEKLDDFFEAKVTLKQIVVEYYLNFIPYFVNLFTPLFIFISVIFFTAQMANRVEIIAILNAGVSFRRLLMPYLFCSLVLAGFSFLMGSYVIPKANQRRLDFDNKYLRNLYELRTRNYHVQTKPGQFVYFENLSNRDKVGYLFTLEKFEQNKLSYKLSADRALWDTVAQRWTLENYFERQITGSNKDICRQGLRLDTAFEFTLYDFLQRDNIIETMSPRELENFIQQEKLRGSGKLVYAQLEKHKRIAFPFAAFILTIIGVSLANRKIRGGIGLQIVGGILLSFSYILFMQISTTFATNSNLPAWLAQWIPNFIFIIIAIWMLRFAQK